MVQCPAGKLAGFFMRGTPWKWTDEEAHAYLLAWWGPQERWRIYGYVDDGGRAFEVADDDEDRSERLMKYLQKIGVPKI
jgi:hypothetical protein